jgi:hypothetical protein
MLVIELLLLNQGEQRGRYLRKNEYAHHDNCRYEGESAVPRGCIGGRLDSTGRGARTLPPRAQSIVRCAKGRDGSITSQTPTAPAATAMPEGRQQAKVDTALNAEATGVIFSE